MTTARFRRSHPPSRVLAALVAGALAGASPLLATAAMAATTTTTKPVTTPTKLAVKGSFPVAPPAAMCGNISALTGPATPPAGALIVAAGDNSGLLFNQPGTSYWFAPGTHTLGSGMYNQIIPAANTTFVGAPGAILDGGGVNDFAFTQTAPGVTIRYLTIQHFVAPPNQGVVNHDSGAKWILQYNTIQNNLGAAVMIGPGDVVSYNCLLNNGQYGFNAYAAGGNSNITIDHNEIAGNDTAQWNVSDYTCGCFGGGKLWSVTGATVTNNYIHDNHGPGIWADANNAGILIDSNYIADNDNEAITYEISYNGRITNNNVLRNGIQEGKSFAAQGSTFPVGAIYVSESGGDKRVDGGLYATFEIAFNNLTGNWGGVILWENADRFCGSAGNPTLCTLGNPTQANLQTCVAPTIDNAPYLSDCRWKTQNVSVHDNTMSFSRSAVGCTAAGCGEQALFSNWGTYPSWSPYRGNVVNNNITYNQSNQFANNAYTGDWQFTAASTTPGTFAAWQAAPVSQDAGSTLSGVTVPPVIANVLDADTASLEASLGHWASWYSATPSRVITQAQTGSASLRIDINAPNGWGVQTDNWPGFATLGGPETISYWALAGAGSLSGALQVQWRDGGGNALRTDTVNLPALTSTWQQATANVVSPIGTVDVAVFVAGATGTAGNYFYLDNIAIGPRSAPPTNLLDADTASLEGSVGHWAPWYSASVAQSTTQAQSGSRSLQVNINAPYGWGVQTDNWPGFAATAGIRTFSFWALAGAGNVGGAMAVQWRDILGNVLQTDTVALPTLTASWQQATAKAVAPVGTATVSVSMSGATGTTGNYFFVDQIFVG